MNNTNILQVSTTRIRSCIKLKPEMLADIKGSIHRQVLAKKDTFNSRYGYIVGVKDIKYSIEGRISRFSEDIDYTVDYTIEHIVPKIGNLCTCKVSKVVEMGIFACFEKIFILIPVRCLNGWKFQGETWTNKDLPGVIEKGSMIDVEITDVKFDKMYKCLGKLN